MKNVFLFLLCFMLHTVVFAQISESDLVGKRFEICHDSGGLDGCVKTATLIFSNSIGDIAINTNGFFHYEGGVKNNFLNGKFIYEIFGGKYLVLHTMPMSFSEAVKREITQKLGKPIDKFTEREECELNRQILRNMWLLYCEVEKTSQGNYNLKINMLSDTKDGIKKEVVKLEMKKF